MARPAAKETQRVIDRSQAILFDDCPADVTRNEVVNVDDLLAVINGYGPCPVGVVCWADVNGDCVVDVDDLLLVINGWGNCPGSFAGGGDPPSVEEQIAILLEILAEHPEFEDQIAQAIELLLGQ